MYNTDLYLQNTKFLLDTSDTTSEVSIPASVSLNNSEAVFNLDGKIFKYIFSYLDSDLKLNIIDLAVKSLTDQFLTESDSQYIIDNYKIHDFKYLSFTYKDSKLYYLHEEIKEPTLHQDILTAIRNSDTAFLNKLNIFLHSLLYSTSIDLFTYSYKNLKLSGLEISDQGAIIGYKVCSFDQVTLEANEPVYEGFSPMYYRYNINVLNDNGAKVYNKERCEAQAKHINGFVYQVSVNPSSVVYILDTYLVTYHYTTVELLC